ncbi:MAG TPA: DUF2786 domain-containing protein [Streptosporangiaceae bacterium]|nr:DUF2786 domain-containing protein [Streptosporangiaceae bacterium]
MGKANRQRRRAKEKDRKRRHAGRPGPAPRPAGPASASAGLPPAQLAAQLVADAVQARSGADGPAFLRCAAQLAERPGVADWWRITEGALMGALEDRVTAVWRYGWQPADVVRAVGRELGSGPARVVGDAIAAEMRGYAAATVDDRWQAQLSALDARVWWAGGDGYLQARGDRDGLDRLAVIVRALDVIYALGTLPRLPLLCPPPGQARAGTGTGTGAAARPGSPQSRAGDERMLARIRALLAKAESTEFPDEAEALSARAQELMARHSIDRALVDARSGRPGEPEGRRLPVDNPYEAPKALLVDVVAAANRCRAVWHRGLGFSTVYGFAADLGAVELLYTSLLVQATTAMVHAGARRDAYGRSRTRSFRSSFLAAYAQRIGERLRATADEVATRVSAEPAGKNLLPVLAARDQAVDRAVEATFPELQERRITGGRDYEGWISGRAAADLASLRPRSGITGPSG